MDPTENLSARVLLRRILVTEPPRTPITRSAAKAQSTSKKDAGTRTPQNILRRSLKNKMRESVTRKSPAITRRKTSTPAPASLLFDDGDTPRHILKNILLTEPVKSPVVHETAASEEPQLLSANSSITRKRPSIELSGLDLPDLTIGHTASTAKGLKRKGPRRSLNVTAFEKRLKDGDEAEVETGESRAEHSSLSLSSSASLTLKTPFVDVQTEEMGLQRRVSNRRKITEKEFGAAVNNRGIRAESSFMPVERGLSETTYTEGFTLGLSKLSEPEITTDIVNCNTALYAQWDGISSNLSIVATQNKPTVMASLLQRRITEMEKETSNVWKDKSAYASPPKDLLVTEDQNEKCFFLLEKVDNATEFQNEGTQSTTVDEPKDTAGTSKSEEGVAETQISGCQDASKSEEEEDRLEGQTEEGTVTRFQSEEELAEEYQMEEAIDSETEEDNRGVGFHPEEDMATLSQSDSEEEEVAPDSQADDDDDAIKSLDSQEVVEANSQPEEEVVESWTEDEHDREQEDEDVEQGPEQLEHNMEHISRRAYHSEGGLNIAVTDAGEDLADATEAGKDGLMASSTFDLQGNLKMGNHNSSQPHTVVYDLAVSSTQGQKDVSFTASESDADKENVDQFEVIHDNEDGNHLSDALPVEANEKEDEDSEENEKFLCKTPAFVRQKRNFFQTDPVLTTSLPKNLQACGTGELLPSAKPKQASQRKRRPAKKEPGLPKNYLMGVFKHFAKTKVSPDVYPALKEIMDTFFDRLAEDLETYAHHAKRNTIEFEDVLLLLKRQGYVNDKVPVEALIEKYLRMDQRRLLIPIATSGNVVIPRKR